MTDDAVEMVAKAMWENPGSFGHERATWDEVAELIARGVFDNDGHPYDPRDGHRSDARVAIATMQAITRGKVASSSGGVAEAFGFKSLPAPPVERGEDGT